MLSANFVNRPNQYLQNAIEKRDGYDMRGMAIVPDFGGQNDI